MALQPINKLKEYFKALATPKEKEFGDLIDSLWHKSEKMPIAQVMGLNDALDDKASKEDLEEATNKLKIKYYESEADLKADQPTPKVGDTAWIGLPYPGTVWICQTDGIWKDSGEVPKVEEVDLGEYLKKAALTNEITDDVDTVPSNLAVHGLQSRL